MGAQLTRRKIIDTAIEMFESHGYDGTTVKDIIDHADITNGTFYYHFESKESLIPAVIDVGWPKSKAVLFGCIEGRFPSLENVIVMTFELAELLDRDKSVRVASRLDQAYSQLSVEGRRGYQSRAKIFTEAVSGALSATDIRDGVTAQFVGDLVWVTVQGCHQLSEAKGDDSIVRLTQFWDVLLHAIVPAESRSYFEQFLARSAVSYAREIAHDMPAAARDGSPLEW